MMREHTQYIYSLSLFVVNKKGGKKHLSFFCCCVSKRRRKNERTKTQKRTHIFSLLFLFFENDLEDALLCQTSKKKNKKLRGKNIFDETQKKNTFDHAQ